MANKIQKKKTISSMTSHLNDTMGSLYGVFFPKEDAYWPHGRDETGKQLVQKAAEEMSELMNAVNGFDIIEKPKNLPQIINMMDEDGWVEFYMRISLSTIMNGAESVHGAANATLLADDVCGTLYDISFYPVRTEEDNCWWGGLILRVNAGVKLGDDE